MTDMPPAIVDRLPLPSMRNYVIFSASMTALALLSAWSEMDDYVVDVYNSTQLLNKEEIQHLYDNFTWSEWSQCMWISITSHLWTLWAMVNLCYCLLALVGKGIQIAVFGKLRVGETQQLKERFWNFAFYKFIFIFGVLNVQYMYDVFIWTAWFSFICGLQLLAELSKNRYSYLSCSPATPKSQHVKLIFLLILITLIAFCLVAASVVTGLYLDWNIAGFMVAECLLLLVKALYVIIKYTIYLVDLNHDGLWETRGTLAYYTDLLSDMLSLTIDLLHSVHMLVWNGIFFSMAGIVVFMQVKNAFTELQKRYSKHTNYLQVVKSMEARFVEASPEEIIAYDDNCAICWDKMQRARKLPCGHLFHNSCLRSWLAQDVSCPTCRVSLSDEKTDQNEAETEQEAPVEQPDPNSEATTAQRAVVRQRPTVARLNRTNHLFRFDASRYVSWLPSFSVEVTHTQLANRQTSRLRSRSSLHAMGRQVQDLFPSVDMASIIEDLRNTHSVEITIENILEGRLTLNPQHPTEESLSSSETESQFSLESSSDDEIELEGAYSLPPGHSQRVQQNMSSEEEDLDDTLLEGRTTPEVRRRYQNIDDYDDYDVD